MYEITDDNKRDILLELNPCEIIRMISNLKWKHIMNKDMLKVIATNNVLPFHPSFKLKNLCEMHLMSKKRLVPISIDTEDLTYLEFLLLNGYTKSDYV